MITLTPKVSASKKAFIEHYEMAISLYDDSKLDAAIPSFRKATEAFLKVYIYNHYGDILGREILDGKKMSTETVFQAHIKNYYYKI